MKKNTTSLLVCGLLLMLAMYNCKRKDSDPLTPNAGKLEELSKINMAPVVLVKPAAVVFVEGAVKLSSRSVVLFADIAALDASAGVLSASAKETEAAVSATFTPAEIVSLTSITPAMLALIESGGTIPADLKAIFAKASSSASLSAYAPTIIYPTVSGTEVRGRIGGETLIPDLVESTNATLISDECITASTNAYNARKLIFDGTRQTDLVAVTAQYNADIALVATTKAACPSTVAAAADVTRAGYLSDYNKKDQALKGWKNILLRIANLIEYFELTTASYTLEKADTTACTTIANAATANAATARTTNTNAVTTSYNNAVSAAKIAQTALLNSCHNQGAGL